VAIECLNAKNESENVKEQKKLHASDISSGIISNRSKTLDGQSKGTLLNFTSPRGKRIKNDQSNNPLLKKIADEPVIRTSAISEKFPASKPSKRKFDENADSEKESQVKNHRSLGMSSRKLRRPISTNEFTLSPSESSKKSKRLLDDQHQSVSQPKAAKISKSQINQSENEINLAAINKGETPKASLDVPVEENGLHLAKQALKFETKSEKGKPEQNKIPQKSNQSIVKFFGFSKFSSPKPSPPIKPRSKLITFLKVGHLKPEFGKEELVEVCLNFRILIIRN